jgi:hypothetical protein
MREVILNWEKCQKSRLFKAMKEGEGFVLGFCVDIIALFFKYQANYRSLQPSITFPLFRSFRFHSYRIFLSAVPFISFFPSFVPNLDARIQLDRLRVFRCMCTLVYRIERNRILI